MEWYFGPLKKGATFQGRARRKEFWYFALIHIGVALTLLLVGELLAAGLGSALYLLYILVTLIPWLAVTTRRLHDTGRSGWYVLMSLIPLVGNIILLVALASDGTPDVNAHGPNPKLGGFAPPAPAAPSGFRPA